MNCAKHLANYELAAIYPYKSMTCPFNSKKIAMKMGHIVSQNTITFTKSIIQ